MFRRLRAIIMLGGSWALIQRALRTMGWAVSRRRVARLMRTAGLRARVVQIYRANPRLHRFYGQHPNRLWARVATRPDRRGTLRRERGTRRSNVRDSAR